MLLIKRQNDITLGKESMDSYFSQGDKNQIYRRGSDV